MTTETQRPPAGNEGPNERLAEGADSFKDTAAVRETPSGAHACCTVATVQGFPCTAGHAAPPIIPTSDDLARCADFLSRRDRGQLLAALRLACDGFPVVALVPGGKGATYNCDTCRTNGGTCSGGCGHPGCHGFHGATLDGPAVFKMWADKPDALIGVPPPPGYLVLDADNHLGAPNGINFLAVLARLGFALPDTLTAVTSAGAGRHFWYRLPPLFPVHSGAFSGCGIDLKRGHNGLVVVPPQPGSQRAWIDYDAQIADAPGWLLDLIRAQVVEPKPPGAVLGHARRPDDSADAFSSPGGRSIEDFNLSHPLSTFLAPAGWTVQGDGDGDEHGSLWRHPYASDPRGCSAKVLVGDDGIPRLANYSRNSGLPDANDGEGACSPFDLLMHLHHGGDFEAALDAVREG